MARLGVPAPVRAAWRHPVLGGFLKLTAVYLLGLEIVVQGLFGKVPLLQAGAGKFAVPQEVFLFGIALGSLYGLLGIGIILVYRANRIINFAQAEIGALPAVVALILLSRGEISYWLALPMVIVGAGVLGLIVEVVFMRRFATAPRLIMTVATIGVAELLAYIEFWIPSWLTGKTLPPQDFPTPFGGWRFFIGVARFSGDHIFAVAVVLVLLGALGAFFRFTDIGIAVRASAENSDRASLLGIPVRRVSTIVWVIAAVFSGLGLFLRGPIVGLPIGGLIGPSVLLFGLAAAVIGRMENLRLCLVSGILLGVLDQTAVFATRRPSLAEAAVLVVILGALLAQRGLLARAHDAAAGSWQVVKEYRTTPSEMRGLPEVRGAGVGVAVFVALIAAVPLLLGQDASGKAALVAIYAMVGVSLVILTGWAGQVSLGQFAFTGVGAAVGGGLAANHHLDFFLCLLLAGLAGAVAAILIGLPALRIQGLFLAVTTLAFTFTVQNILLNRTYTPWLLPKEFTFADRPVLYGRVSANSNMRFYVVTLVFLGLVLLMARSLRNKRSGRVLLGIRDNPKLGQAFGVNPARTKLAAFALSGFIAALAGGLLAFQQTQVIKDGFSPTQSLEVFAMVVIGGLTSLWGAVLGAVYVVGIPLLLGGNLESVRLLSTGVGLLLLLLFLPGGLSQGLFGGRDSFLRWVAARRGLVVPSLVADVRVDAAEVEAQDRVVTAGAETALSAEVLQHTLLEDTVACPACGQLVLVSEVREHEHFRPPDHLPAYVGAGAGDDAGAVPGEGRPERAIRRRRERQRRSRP